MMTILRHLLSILLLPFVVVLVMPFWINTSWTDVDSRWAEGSQLFWLFRSLGAALIVVGFALFSWCIGLFGRVGKGTLAPWDATRNLVAVGPYRFVRNPMISGVALMLIGQALFRGSWMVCLWGCTFIVVNHVYFVLFEEPGLEKRFGEQYRMYKAQVPRWVPRLRPWPGK